MTLRPELLEHEIPTSVLEERGDLTIHQALCYYLCDEPNGPGCTYREAAELLGLNTRREVGKHLQRARKKLIKELIQAGDA